tara:strand:- start:20768 stop:21013 length:246 start_codon:yes stop_codon:yes gene_type:complete
MSSESQTGEAVQVNPYLHRFTVMPDWANELAFLRSEMAKLQAGIEDVETGLCTLSELTERKPEHDDTMDDPKAKVAETTTE